MAASTESFKLAVVTGASSGIGRALASALAQQNVRVVAVARRKELLDTLTSSSDKITAVVADLTTKEGRNAVASTVASLKHTIDFLIHNAAGALRKSAAHKARARCLRSTARSCAVVGPVGTRIQKVDEDEFKRVMEINVMTPLFLTQALLPYMSRPGGRILHISSGAAHKAMQGMTTYCVSKSALFFVYRSLKMEFEHEAEKTGQQQLFVGSVRPGVVESQIQQTMRTADPEGFTSAPFFKDMHANMAKASSDSATPPPKDALDTPENVARFIWWLLDKVPAEEFAAEEWDIRDEAHHARWTK